MNVKPRKELAAMLPLMKEWMGAIHQNPELSTHEVNTAKYVAQLLKEMGLEVHEHVGRNGIEGVVGVLRHGDGNKKIGIRADMDALPIQEINHLPYKSKHDGISHLCGHDGHTAMALGAAKYLAETKNFNGTVYFYFQPAEETMQGGPSMIDDGLFVKFKPDRVYAMHNIPGLPKGVLHFHDGETMSAVDNWEIRLIGRGCHGSMPELSIDPVVAGASLVMALQTIVSRNLSPWSNGVVTIGSFQAGNSGNVIPNEAVLKLSMRNMQSEGRTQVLQRIREITAAQAQCFGCQFEIKEGQPGTVLINSHEETAFAAKVACKYFGEENVVYPCKPMMSSEDFAFMLQQTPGSYIMIGNGDTPMVHNPQYNFDQEILPVGATLWVALCEEYLI
ncbi:MAG: M20 aminoacylase family protein [Prevotella sp.]|nr:M20 aminoacylase family protein [Prevotella sp.]